MKWKSAHVIVTGGGSGIGRALVLEAYRRGANVVIADLDGVAAGAVASECVGEGQVRAVAVDVSCSDQVEAMIEAAVEAFGPVDLLCNNAGVGQAGPVELLDSADWNRLVDVNIKGVVHGISAVYPRMCERGSGAILNTASGAGLCPRPYMTPYAMTKSAVVGLSVSLHVEAESKGVYVGVFCPGYVQTQILESTQYKGVNAAALTAQIPIRPMSAERCATLALAGVEKRRAITPISWLVRVEWWMWRLCPALSFWVARRRSKAFERALINE